MLLRHAVQQRRIIFCRGFPRCFLSNSSKAAESKEPTRESKKRSKPRKSGHASSNSNEKPRIGSEGAQTIWNLLGRGVEDPGSPPRANDNSWRNSKNAVKEETGTKARLCATHFSKIVDDHCIYYVNDNPQDAKHVFKDSKHTLRLFPWTYHPIHSPTPPNPTTPSQLVANLIAMRNAVPVIAFIKIVRYHDCFPWLQSSKSFNTVLELAVRHSAIGTARKLLRAMQVRGEKFDDRTVALVMRLRVRLGHRNLLKLRRRWLPQSTLGAHNRLAQIAKPGERLGLMFGDAVEAELAQVQHGASLEVLSEFLGTPHRVSNRDYREAYLKAFRRDVKKVSNFERLVRKKRKRVPIFLPKLMVANVTPRAGSPVSSYDRISREYDALAARPTKDFTPRASPLSPTLTTRLVAKVYPAQTPGTIHRVSLLLARRFLMEGKREVAIRFATAHAEELCAGRSSLPSRIVTKILQITHLLLHPKYGCSSFTDGRNTLMAMLRLHPDLHPQPQTLVILLQNLRMANRRSVRAYEALQWFQKRWPRVEDESVRRTVAKFALQGKSSRGEEIAWEMAQREADLGTRWRMPVAGHQDLLQPQARAFRSIYTREHRDKQEWIRMGLITRRGGFELSKRRQK